MKIVTPKKFSNNLQPMDKLQYWIFLVDGSLGLPPIPGIISDMTK
jgi:hypothetical protein